MKKLWEDDAWEEYKEWLNVDKKILKRVNELIKDIERYGVLEGRGKPEKLKYREEYSRRIDEEHRLIYKVQNNIIIIVSCKGHYVKERK